MQEHECSDDRVEGLVLERQCSRVSMHELDARDVGACIGEHRVREVDADRIRTALGRFRGDVAGACSDIEEPCPPAGVHRIEERLCDLGCHAAQEPVVRGGILRRPAGFLERIECVGVVLGHDLQYERSFNEIGWISPPCSAQLAVTFSTSRKLGVPSLR